MRRFWGILIAVIALAALLAVPAMAATHDHGTCVDNGTCAACGANHAEWNSLGGGATTITSSGNYFLSDDVSANVTVSGANTKVTICLNGRTWSGANGNRPLTVTEGAEVRIVDCSARTGYISAGKIVGVDLTAGMTDVSAVTSNYGGTIYVNNASVEIHNGTITGGCAHFGGNIFVTAQGTVTFLGGKVTGSAKASSATAADFATGGIAYKNGGNVYVGQNGKFVMGSQTLQGTANANVIPAIQGGSNYLNPSSGKPNGGSVFVADKGTFELHSGRISGGKASNDGENIHVEGTLKMTGGWVGGNVSTGVRKNVYILNGNLEMSGGEIAGRIGVSNTTNTVAERSTIKLSGSAKITGVGLTLGRGTNTSASPKVVIDGALNAEAKLVIASRNADLSTAENVLITATDNWDDYEAYVRGTDPQITITSASNMLTYEEDGIRVRSVTGDTIWHCLCAAERNEAHLGDCTHYDYGWEPHVLTGTESLPTTSGHYYLVDGDNDANQNQVAVGYTNIESQTDAADIYVDFRGVTVLRNTAQRFLRVKGAEGVHHSVTFTDSSANHSGGIVTDFSILDNHSNIWLQNYGTLNCYHLNIDCSKATIRYGAGIRAETANTFVNLYNCHLIGGTTSEKEGGAIFSAGTVQILGGTITGGTAATNGGTIYTTGTMTIKGGCTITGGTAVKGGAVYVGNGTFNLYDGTITGGTAREGGNVYVNTKATFNAIPDPAGEATGAVRLIEAGAAESATESAKGGNFYVYSGTLNLDGATVSNGTASFDGAVYDANNKLVKKYGIGGNICLYGTDSVVNVKNQSLVTGGTVSSLNANAKSWAPGGNIYISGSGTVNVENATITNGMGLATQDDTNVSGKNLYLDYNTTVNLKKGAVVSNTSTAVTRESILIQGGTLRIADDASITTAEGVTGRNISTNDSAYKNSNPSTPVIEMTGGTISGGNFTSGGNVYLNNLAVMNMSGGTIEEGRATTEYGGNVYLTHLAQLNVTGGTIQNGYAKKNGGNIYAASLTATDSFIASHNTKVDPDNTQEDLTAVDLAAKVTISGASKITGGSNDTAEANGGSIFMGYNTSLAVGGSAEISGGSTTNCGGNIYSNGNVILGGKAKVYGGNAKASSAQPNIFVVNGQLTLQENAQVAGGAAVHGASATLILKGAPTVDKALTAADKQMPSESMKITNGALVQLNGLLAGANVGLQWSVSTTYYTQDPATKGYMISGDVGNGDLSGIRCENKTYTFMVSGGKLVAVPNDKVSGVTINGSSVLYTLEAAVEKAAAGDFLTLSNSIANATISKSVLLDLDGYDLTNLTLAKGAELTLFDFSTADYAVDEVKDEQGNVTGYTGYGKVTLSADSKGTILRQGNTPKATYGKNYRYVVVKEGDTYSAHRIYMTVKSTILYPNKPAVNYRTVLRCDQMVAKYINAEGGGFGILASAASKSYSDYTDGNILANSWGEGNENNLVTQLSRLLDAPGTAGYDAEKNELKATTKVRAQAYIFLADDFSGEKLASGTEDKDVRAANAELIAAEGLTSTGVNQSMEGLVKAAFAKDPASLSMLTRDALYNMYSTWKDDLMGKWTLSNMDYYIGQYENRVDLRYACLCGHPESTDNPCADNGHVTITWRAWTEKGKFPSVTGNYYLTENLTLTEQGKVEESDFINLNTNGFDITVKDNRRVALVYGVLNITNFGVDGQAVSGSTLTANAPKDYDEASGGNGGVLLIPAGGNVSLYSGVTLAALPTHNIWKGVVEVNGDLNIYGGNIQGTTLNTTEPLKDADGVVTEKAVTPTGGAVSVGATGYLYMNSGSITGGEAALGGAIFMAGREDGTSDARVELDGGTITGGKAKDGGMIYVMGGELINRGVDLDATGCQAGRGALMFLSGGKATMFGTAEDKLTLTGGYAVTESATATSGYKGSGAVFYVADGLLDLDHCTINAGRNVKGFNSDGTVTLYGSGVSGQHGGSAFFVSGGEVTLDASAVNGYTAYGTSKQGGTIYMAGGKFTVNGDASVSGNTTINASYATSNGSVMHMSGGTFIMHEGTTLTSKELFTKKVTAGITYGGTVSMDNSKASFYMHGGEITGGVTKTGTQYGGGNLNMSNGKFFMYGGAITDGVRKGTSTGGNAGGGNIRMIGGTFTMTGGSITGGLDETGNGGGILMAGGTLDISGNARITGNTNGTDANNIYLARGKTIKLGELKPVNGVSPALGVTMATYGGYVTADHALTSEEPLKNYWLVSDLSLDTGKESGEKLDYYIGRYGCVCGATSAEECIAPCNGEKLMWIPWLNETHLPDQDGRWYLAYKSDEVTVTQQASIGAGTTTNLNVAVDLNGKRVERAVNDDNNRFFAIEATETENVVTTLTITDSSLGHKGELICASEDGTGKGLGVWMNQTNCALSIYRGTIDASGSVADKNGGVVINAEKGQVNLYGGKLLGGVTHKHGGAINLASGTALTMTGGQIVGGQALCTQRINEKTPTSTTTKGGITYTYNNYECGSHGYGGAVYVSSGASFTMSGGSVVSPELTEAEKATFRGAGFGGLIYAAGTLNLSGNAVIRGGRANGAGIVVGEGGTGHGECGYGGNIYVSGTMHVSGNVTISDGYASAGSCPVATYTDPATGEVKTLSAFKSIGGGLGGNIVASGTLNMTAGTVENGEAFKGGNIGVCIADAKIHLGTSGGGQVAAKTLQILNGTANTGGNIAINVRPCSEFVIDPGTWIEGGVATADGGNISITVTRIDNDNYVKTDADTYATRYEMLATVNGGTITGGIAGNRGGNIFVDGEKYANTNTAYPEVEVYAVLNLGTSAKISNGAAGGASGDGNNLYLLNYAEATVACPIINNLYSIGDTIVGLEGKTVKNTSVYVREATNKLTLNAGASLRNEKASGAATTPYMRNLYINGTFNMNGGTISGGNLNATPKYGSNVYMAGGTATLAGGTISGGRIIGGSSSAPTYGANLYMAKGTLTISGATITGGFLNGGYSLGGNLYMEDGKLTLSGGIVTEGRLTGAFSSGGNLYMKKGTLTISGGSVTEGALTAGAGHGGNIYMLAGTLNMSSGLISRGYVTKSSSHGGNLYVASGTVKVSGGTISGGTCLLNIDNAKVGAYDDGTEDYSDADLMLSGNGGNIYIASGSVTLSGEAKVTDGKVARGGGNVYINTSATFTMKDSATVTNGLSSRTNGGNIYVNGGSFIMENGTVSGGRTYDGGGNVYATSTVTIKGGLVTGAECGLRWDDAMDRFDYHDVYDRDHVKDPCTRDTGKDNANLYMVGGDALKFTMSGGEISTGVRIVTTSTNPEAISLSGNSKILGTGLYLGATDAAKGYLNNVDVSNLGSGSEIYIYTPHLPDLVETPNYMKLIADDQDEAYAQKLLKAYKPESCRVVYLSEANAPDGAGIYLYNLNSNIKIHCLCGANEGESHLPLNDGTICTGEDMIWKPWTQTYMPDQPGNWYLHYTVMSDSADGTVKYKGLSGGFLRSDFYKDDNGNWQPVRALLALDYKGDVIQLPDKSYQQVTDANGNPVWLATDGLSVVDLGEHKVVDSYTINVDLNGFKLEGPAQNRTLSFYGRNEFKVTETLDAAWIEQLNGYGTFGTIYTKTQTDINGVVTSETQHYATHRKAKVQYTITDSSQGHTAVLATGGRYSGNVRSNMSVAQGSDIWMNWKEDVLTTYRFTLDASNTTYGWGMALMLEGTAYLNDTTLIGGTAQGYYSKVESVTDENGQEHQVSTLGGSVMGGGALYISETGKVRMYGGTIRDGRAIYRYMDASNGVNNDRAVGGGNVYVDGVFNVIGTSEYPASITGGKALYYAEPDGEVNNVPLYAVKQGGGVYLGQGSMSVEGDVSITGNTIGTVTSATAGAAAGTVIPTAIENETSSNLFLNGKVVAVKALTGTVGYTMNGTTWEGAFAQVDTGDTAYDDSGKLAPDVTPQVNSVVYQNGMLYYKASNTTLQVGYGAASIFPTQNDIRNGLALGGYGNDNYFGSKEKVRMTRYWTNTDSGVEKAMPATVAARMDPSNEDFIDMRATAMAFRDKEGDTVIVINADYNNISELVGNNVKRLVSNATGVPVDHITISASHQHSSPAISTVYWTNQAGDHTVSRDLTGVTSGTYKTLIYGNEKLQLWEEWQIRTNYYDTFYTGVRDAAVAAYNDLADVISVKAGIMDTTTGGKQFNFVRNVALYKGDDYNNVLGITTDNHTTHLRIGDIYYAHATVENGVVTGVMNGEQIAASLIRRKAESELDVTMQLVRYERNDKTIVLANFQSHPHVSDRSSNLNPNGGVVEVFRRNLSKAYEDSTGKTCEVLYFSGAGGNVNSNSLITAENGKQPWYELAADGETYVDLSKVGTTEPAQKLIQGKYHGQELAKLAHVFVMNANNQLNQTVSDLVNADVQAVVQDFEYTVWDETKDYTFNGNTIPATWSDTKFNNAHLLVDWNSGNYLGNPSDFDDAEYADTGLSYWHYFQAPYANKNDRIYSYFHANSVRKRLQRKETNDMTGSFKLTAYDLGGIGFIAAPYEMFQENGQAIKGNVQAALKASQPDKYAQFPDYVTNGCGYIVSENSLKQEVTSSPYAITIVASQANGSQGYIPSYVGYKNGGYSTDTAMFEPGTAEQLVTAYVDMLHTLKGE